MKRKRMHVDWTTQPLGQIPDAAIADRIGCHPMTVCRARARLGIRAFRESHPGGRPKGIDWDAQPLGKATDQSIAAAAGVSHQRVQKVRHARGIPAYRDTKVEDLARRIAGDLGRLTDSAVARRHGISAWQARAARLRLGLPPGKDAVVSASRSARDLLLNIERLLGDNNDLLRRLDRQITEAQRLAERAERLASAQHRRPRVAGIAAPREGGEP